MDTAKSTFSKDLKIFDELTCSPEIFLDQAPAESKGFQNVSKKLYQNSVEANSLTCLKANSLHNLLVDGFDQEQIWQQVELQNKSAALHFINNLPKFESNSPDFNLDVENSVALNGNVDEDYLSDAQSLSDDYQDPPFDDANESHHIDFDDGENDDDLDDGENDDDLDDGENDDEEMNAEEPKSILKKSVKEDVEKLDDEVSDEEVKAKEPKSILKKSVKGDLEKLDDDGGKSSTVDKLEKYSKKQKFKSKVDDQFFKLSKLEQFLRVEDLKEDRARDGNLNEDKESDEDEEFSDDEDIDLFQDIPSDDMDDEDESEDEEITNKKSSRELMYEDFFDAPDSGDENVDENETSDQEQKDDFNDTEMDFAKDEGDSEEDDVDQQGEPVPDLISKSKTPFELEQEKVKQQILDYEEKMLKPAAWHLTGEVVSSARPVDALLHLQTDFEMNAKPVVIQDKPLCEKLEAMLKTTIKNKSFSDGVKQFKTNDEIIAKKKEIAIEQTKSKKGLAQEYEEMYLKKKHGQEEEENPKHKEIKKLMDSLFPELHALFSHIPKPAIPEIKIVSNLPAISVEEVAPTSVSDVTLLAPEEVKKRTGIVKGQTERTDVDRKQERRKKKLHQKMKQKKREKESSDKPLTAKAQKREKIDMIRKLKQQRNTKFAKVDGQKVKSSKDFFEKLQETVSSTVSKIQAKKKS